MIFRLVVRSGRAEESEFLEDSPTCRDGPAGRLYGAPPSSEILALRTRGFGSLERRAARHRREAGAPRHVQFWGNRSQKRTLVLPSCMPAEPIQD